MPAQIEPLTSGSLICTRTLGTRGKKDTPLSDLATTQRFSHQHRSFSIARICCQTSARNFEGRYKLSPPQTQTLDLSTTAVHKIQTNIFS